MGGETKGFFRGGSNILFMGKGFMEGSLMRRVEAWVGEVMGTCVVNGIDIERGEGALRQT